MSLFRFKRAKSPPRSTQVSYSWILSNEFAIGQLPFTRDHWQQLSQAGFRSRFSCCYPEEEFAPAPDNWNSVCVSLPDHRQQEPLTELRLRHALNTAEEMLQGDKLPVYLHCLAGKERSSLIAVGLIAKRRNMDIFTALEWVRRCHPAAQPIYEQLDLMDKILSSQKLISDNY